MYIEQISITNLRVFAEAKAVFQFPDRPAKENEQKLTYPNLNLILGNNGAGKSTLLKAIGLAVLGPLAQKFSPYLLVRRRMAKLVKPTGEKKAVPVHSYKDEATVVSRLRLTWQDRERKKPDAETELISWKATVTRRGDEEEVNPNRTHSKLWAPINVHANAAFFAVGYGATRRVDTDPGAATPAQKLRSIPLRQQRVQSLFSDGYTLVPLGQWLPELAGTNPGRHKQVCDLINEILPENIAFPGTRNKSGEYLFAQNGTQVPFAALSDGCRAFVGWVADMLYHLCFGCPPGVKLVENRGIVLVDEIDLHLHPEWQRTVLPRLSTTFPNLQFIVTSHSPIVVGSLQRGNLWVSEAAPDGNGSVLDQKEARVHGLSADQILLTEYFGLESSRAPEKQERLKHIAAAAERNVPGKAAAFLESLVSSLESENASPPANAKKTTKAPSRSKAK